MRKKRGKGHSEAFDFVIEDNRATEERGLGQISGGEQAIVSEATRIGLTLFQAGRRGAKARFRTLLRDEPASSLSSGNARRYVQMLHKAREIGGFHQIFFVIHDEEAWVGATARLHVADSGVSVMKRVGDRWRVTT